MMPMDDDRIISFKIGGERFDEEEYLYKTNIPKYIIQRVIDEVYEYKEYKIKDKEPLNEILWKLDELTEIFRGWFMLKVWVSESYEIRQS